jgi:plasmid stabilization system protein ParE
MPAVNQLQSIFDFIAEEKPAAAKRTIRRIHRAILATARMPNSGRIGRVKGTREITVTGTRHVVAYRVLEKMIQVLAVFHGAQKWPESF